MVSIVTCTHRINCLLHWGPRVSLFLGFLLVPDKDAALSLADTTDGVIPSDTGQGQPSECHLQ